MVNRLVFVKFQNKEERIFQRIEKHEKMHQRKKKKVTPPHRFSINQMYYYKGPGNIFNNVGHTRELPD